jgi:multiple sugar transport system permease protein
MLTQSKKHFNSIAGKEEKLAFLFVMPFMIGYTIFTVIPSIATFILGFLDLNTFAKMGKLNEAKFVGLSNFSNLLQDSSFLQSFLRSLKYLMIYAPCLVVFSLLLALLLNREFYFKKAATTMIFMPYVTNVSAIALIIGGLFLQPFDGPVNTFLRMVGISNPPMWLAGVDTALPTVAVVAAWQGVAFQTVIFIVALKGVSKELYEAAGIDGCTGFRRFFAITLPLISPVTFLVIITAVIQSFSSYGIINTMTQGGPGDSSYTLIFNIIATSFSYNKYSYASAQALIQFVVILVITLIQWWGQKKWVHY